jgi:hypothetical protein
VLLDESVPRDLLLHLAGIDVVTVQQLGWAGMKNGALFTRRARGGYSSPDHRRSAHRISTEHS